MSGFGVSHWGMDDIQRLDRSWGQDKIAMLVDGLIEVDGAHFYGQSAYEQRCAAESSADDFSDLIIEPAQLDQAIRRGVQRDFEVRAALLLRTRLGLDEYEIENLIHSGRPGYRLLERGIELIRRHERGAHSQLRRVRAQKGESDGAVCWRCMKVGVPQPGMECGECPDDERPPQQRGLLRGTRHPGHRRAPLYRTPAEELSDSERASEISALKATQDSGDYFQSKDRDYREHELPIGIHLKSESDLRAKDAAYHRRQR